MSDSEEIVEEVLSASQALIIVLVVIVVVVSYTVRWWRDYSERRFEESFLQYDFALPQEKVMMDELVKQRPDEKDVPSMRGWHLKLVQTHFKRVMAVIGLHERVMGDYQTQMTLYKRGISTPLLPQVEHAKELVQREVQECGAIANSLKPGWGQTIFPEAYKLKASMEKTTSIGNKSSSKKQELKEKENEELAEITRVELEHREKVRAKAEKELLAESS